MPILTEIGIELSGPPVFEVRNIVRRLPAWSRQSVSEKRPRGRGSCSTHSARTGLKAFAPRFGCAIIKPMKESAYHLDHDRVEIARSRLPPPVISSPTIGRWRLEAAYTYHDNATAITVPAGFEFDLSSVPRVFWQLIAPFELSIVAPLLHDYLYGYGGRPPAGSVDPPRTYSRAEVDRMFRQIMEAEGVSAWRRVLAYAAVRTFGRSAWRA